MKHYQVGPYLFKIASFLLASSVLPLVLGGCAANFGNLPNVNVAAQTPIGNLRGSAYGGQQPIWNSHVYLMAASKSGYGMASTSLLQSSSNTTADTTVLGTPTDPAYYVTSDSAGNFNITGDYTCNYVAADPSESDQLYILSLQGNTTYLPGNPATGGANNPMIALMATLGQCPSTGTFAGNISFIYVNEISTVATAYALAGFATNSRSIGSASSPLAQVGMANAFANANQMYDIQGSQQYHEARTTTPGTGITGTVPQALIDTLGNIIAKCVNTGNTTVPPTSGGCLTLYNNTASSTNTADALIYIAQHPASNVTNLFGMQMGAVQFADDLATAPQDFSVGINYAGTGLTTPVDVAIDASGDAWVTSSGGTVSRLTPLGVHASGSPFTVSGANYVALDQTGNAWITTTGNKVAELSSSGAVVSGTPYINGDFDNPAAIAGDGSGDMFIANVQGSGLLNVFGLLGQYGDLIKINGSGSAATQTVYSNSLLYLGAELNQLPSVSQIAVDSQGYVWASGDKLGCVALVLCSGQNVERLSGSNFTTSGFSFLTPGATCLLGCTNEVPQGIAIDSANNGWVAFSGSTDEIQKITSAGVATVYTGGGLSSGRGVAADGAGNVFVANSGNNSVSEFSSSGSPITGSSIGFTGGTLHTPTTLDVDESGNVWVVNSAGNSVTELIGIATPAVRPLAAAAVAGKLGSTP